MTGYKLGVWVWGVVLVVWLLAVILGLACGAVGPATRWYGAISSNGPLVGAITAVLGVIWSWFIQLDQRDQQFRQEIELKRTSAPQ